MSWDYDYVILGLAAMLFWDSSFRDSRRITGYFSLSSPDYMVTAYYIPGSHAYCVLCHPWITASSPCHFRHIIYRHHAIAHYSCSCVPQQPLSSCRHSSLSTLLSAPSGKSGKLFANWSSLPSRSSRQLLFHTTSPISPNKLNAFPHSLRFPSSTSCDYCQNSTPPPPALFGVQSYSGDGQGNSGSDSDSHDSEVATWFIENIFVQKKDSQHIFEMQAQHKNNTKNDI